MLKKIIEQLKPLLLVGFVLSGLVVLIGGQPGHLNQQQSVVIRAAPARIAPFLIDFRRWEEWSTWSSKYDSQFSQTFEGPASGIGAAWSWHGANGRGARFEIARIDDAKIVMTVRRTSPINGADFELTPEGEGTRVTWHTTGMAPLLVGLFSKVDVAAYEKDVEVSLANLKTVVETAN